MQEHLQSRGRTYSWLIPTALSIPLHLRFYFHLTRGGSSRNTLAQNRPTPEENPIPVLAWEHNQWSDPNWSQPLFSYPSAKQEAAQQCLHPTGSLSLQAEPRTPTETFLYLKALENNLNTMLSCQIKCLHGGFGSAWSSLALPWADPPHLLAARVRGQVLVFQYGLGQEITLKKRKKNTKTTERERESNRYIPVLRVNQESKIRNNLCFKMWSTECIMMAALARSNKGCFLVVLKQCCSVHQNAIYSTKLKTSVVPYLLTFIP